MSEDPITAFTSIGLITHHFEQCEFHLSELFQLLCEAENEAPFQVFGEIVSSNLRLTMTKIALRECLPRSSRLKTNIADILDEFSECQTIRNRAVHQSIIPHIRRRKLAYVGRPLWHQTIRYEKGRLKPGRENPLGELRDASYRVTTLVFAMKGVLDELFAFLEKRKRNRLRIPKPERASHKGAR